MYIYPFVWNSDFSLGVRRRWLKLENISEIGPDYDYIDTGSAVMAECTSAIGSVYQVGLIIFLTDVLMLVRGPWLVVGIIGDVPADILTTSRETGNGWRHSIRRVG